MLKKLGVGSFTKNMIEEINNCKICYNRINDLNNDKVGAIKSKKKYIMILFECFCSIFHFDYDEKIRFNKKTNDDNIHFTDFENLDFDSVFYRLYRTCFYHYLKSLHLYKSLNIDSQMYTISRLAYLVEDTLVINKLIDNSYNNLLVSVLDIENKKDTCDISKDDVIRLWRNYRIRQEQLVNEVLRIEPDKIDAMSIRTIYKSLSSDIYDHLDDGQKLYIMNLLYCYFGGSDKKSFLKKYKSIVRSSTNNKDCLSYVINELMLPGNTMIVKRKNMDMAKDVLSGISYIYGNESKLENINVLDDLINIVNIPKR